MRKGTEHFLLPVKSVEELPPPVCAAIRAVQPDSGIRQIIVIPSQEYPVFRFGWLRDLPFGWRKTPKRTLVFGEDQITLVEESPEGLATILIPYATICDLHLCTVLLYAYMELYWLDGAQIKSLKVEFTLVGLPYIRRGLEHVRSRMLPTRPTATAAEPLSLAGMPLKFRNFTRSSLLPGETARFTIFQPAVRRDNGIFHPLFAPNCAAAITDYHLIFIEENVNGACRDYAANMRFYPLSRLCGVEVQPGEPVYSLRLTVGIGAATRTITMPASRSFATTLQCQLNETTVLYENHQYNENLAY